MTEDDHRPQRRGERHATTLFVWYVRLKSAVDNPRGHLAHTADVSANGLAIHSAVELPIDDLLFFEITGSQGNVSAVGRVVHCTHIEDKYYRVGVRFEVVPPNDRPMLARLANQ